MWQSLARAWLMRTAKEQVARAAQRQAAASSPAGDAGACQVGVVAALDLEVAELVDRLSEVVHLEGAGFSATAGTLGQRRIVVMRSGPGRAAAARASEALLAGHRPAWVISAGLAGGLDARLALGDLLMADEVLVPGGPPLSLQRLVDPASLASGGRVHVGRLLTVDEVVASASAKRALGERHAALAVDMESYAVAEVCRSAQVRFLALRAVSDTVERELPPEVDHLLRQRSWAGRLGAATGAVFRRPSSVKDLWQLKESALLAAERLAELLVDVIARLDAQA